MKKLQTEHFNYNESEFSLFREVKGCDYGDSSVAKEPGDRMLPPFFSSSDINKG